MLRRALLTLWFFLPFTYCVTIAAAHPAGSLPPGQLHMENRAPSTALSDTPVLPDTPVQPLRMVIQTLETASGYRFLYRDALVAGVRIRFEFNENWKDALKKELRAAGLDLVINERRKQIVIFPAGDAGDAGYAREIISMKPLRGYVIDEQTGERLPFATVIRIVSKEQTEGTGGTGGTGGTEGVQAQWRHHIHQNRPDSASGHASRSSGPFSVGCADW